MTGIGGQFQFILRDETVHLNFGIDLINGIKDENPELWTEAFQQEMVEDYVQYIADRRLERIGLPKLYNSSSPFPWMSETIDLAKEKNFFETRVTEYQSSASLEW